MKTNLTKNLKEHECSLLSLPEAGMTCRKSTKITGVVHEKLTTEVAHKKQTNCTQSLEEQHCSPLPLPAAEIDCDVQPDISGSVNQEIKLETVDEHKSILTRNIKEHEVASSSSTAAEIGSGTSSCNAGGQNEEMNLDIGREKQLHLREHERESLSSSACTVSSNAAAGALEDIKSEPVHGKQLNFTKNYLKQKRPCFELNHRLNSLIKTTEVQGDMNDFKQRDSGVAFKILFKQFEAMIDKSKVINKFKTQNGDIYMLISLERVSKSVLFNASKALDSFEPVTFIVDLKSVISDALESTDFDAERNCNEAWVIEHVLKRL